MNFQLISCAQKVQNKKIEQKNTAKEIVEIIPAASRFNLYTNLLKDKNIAIVANQTSVVQSLQRAEVAPNVMGSKKIKQHLVDYLNSKKNINVQKVFAPEHGFRGKADAAELVKDGKDAKTGLPIISLYGKNKKPTAAQLKNIDVVVFDIQDVGVRFYTYISTLHYVMEACAEAAIPVIILDRPNPNAHYIDGPTLEMEHTSFVGKHPVPVVYGLTIGEYGKMINGEKWLKNGIQCDLTVIPIENYNHDSEYHLEVRPSPNLPNDKSINLYPSLGFFEGTTINAGRGTEFQFQRYGAPFFPKTDFSYTPKPNFGAKYPKHRNQLCYGVDLSDTKKLSAINLEWLIDAYQKTPKTEKFFGSTFTIHAGNTKLQQQIQEGLSAKEIRKTWQKDLESFQQIRVNYLIYD
ncbi:exo-beta-N-acetylmuramidase NamZ family protein [Polaribacter sp. P097]|uniref:exo-beta-N-acetylmuramidase NamZ family protein n=1 Tax=Polaribacter sp. P097 TaxID=3117398 RepID=UPI002FDF6D6E